MEQTKIPNKESLNVQVKPKEIQPSTSNSLFPPQTKPNLDSPSEYFTPKVLNRDSAFFDKSLSLIDDLGDYTDIGGILHEESLISTKVQIQNTTHVEVEQNESENRDNIS